MGAVKMSRGRLRIHAESDQIALPASNMLDSRPKFLVSNEPSKPSFKRGAKVFTDISRGIDAYVGVTGGGSQNLMLLSGLHRGNSDTLKRADLVDIEPLQQQNFAIMARENNEARESVFQHSVIIEGIKIPEEKYAHFFKIPVAQFEKDIDVRLHASGMYEFLRGPIPKGRYALYFSNIPLWESNGGMGAFRETLSFIAQSNKFEEGTTILVNRVLYLPTVMVKKGGRIEVVHKEPLRIYVQESLSTAISMIKEARGFDGLRDAVKGAWEEIKEVPKHLRDWAKASHK